MNKITYNSIQKQTAYTVEALSDELSLDLETLRRTIYRMGHRYGKDDLLPAAVVRDVVAKYAQPHSKRSDEVMHAAMEIASQMNININVAPSPSTNNAQETEEEKPALIHQPAKKEEKPVRKRSRLVNVLIYIAFISILVYQLEHVAMFGADISVLSNETARQASGFLFAFAVGLTALLMTLWRGTSAVIRIFNHDISYIAVFAVIDYILFVIAVAPWERGDASATFWAKTFIGGGATAFIIYSFNELLTTK